MKTSLKSHSQKTIWITVSCVLLLGCGASFPVPNDQMASAQKDVGRAEQGGAQTVPDAKLHLQLAQENLAKAKELMEKDNKRALSLINRASAEAELALILANEVKAKTEAQQLLEQLNNLKKSENKE